MKKLILILTLLSGCKFDIDEAVEDTKKCFRHGYIGNGILRRMSPISERYYVEMDNGERQFVHKWEEPLTDGDRVKVIIGPLGNKVIRIK